MSANNKKQFWTKDNFDAEDCFCFWLGLFQILSIKVGLVASERNLGHAILWLYIYILVCRQKNLFHSFNFLVFTAIQVMVFPLQKNISRTFGIGRGRLYSIIVAWVNVFVRTNTGMVGKCNSSVMFLDHYVTGEPENLYNESIRRKSLKKSCPI